MAEVLTQDQIEAAEAAGATDLEISHILNLKRLAADFAQAFSNMLSWGDAVQGTDLEADYHKLMDRGFSLRDEVASLMNTIDGVVSTVASWWHKAISLIPGLGTIRPYDRDSLGFVWFIPLAAIVAVTGVLGYWLADYAKFARRFSEMQRIAADLEAEGVAPVEANRQAGAIVAGAVPGLFSNLGNSLGLIALVGGGWLLYRWSRGRT